MKRLPKIAALTLLACFLFLLAAWVVRDVYVGLGDKAARIVELESKVQDLQRVSHREWRLRWISFSISSSDRPQISQSSQDLRLAYGTNAVQKFDDELGKEPGRIMTAWISDWTPRSEMTKFEQLSVSNRGGTKFDILAKAHTNESVAMEFKVTFIIEE